MESAPIKLIVGLGNPGEKYTKTRHNAGFLFIDELSRLLGTTLKADKHSHGLSVKASIENHEFRLLKPTTYMNLSGQAVVAACQYYKCQLNETLVVHDEIDSRISLIKVK